MATETRKIVNKDLGVIFQIKEVKRRTNKRPASIIFEFVYPSYLQCSTELADDLVNKLISQMMGDIQIKNLRLSWFEDLPK